MLAAKRLFVRIVPRQRRKLIQGLLLGICNCCEKGQILSQWMTRGKITETPRAAAEQIPVS